MELIHIRDHEIWNQRNKILENRLKILLSNDSLPNSRLDIPISRCKIASGFNGNYRVGLVFSGINQQVQFAQSFAEMLLDKGCDTFSLVATGTSFQVLSTNPAKPDNWFFGQGELDLDLQIYCPSLVRIALARRVDLFPNMYDVLHNPLEVRLSTFYNYSDAEKGIRGLDEIAPWVHEFEEKWASELAGTWGEPCPIHAALMNHDVIPCHETSLGCPFELIRYENGQQYK